MNKQQIPFPRNESDVCPECRQYYIIHQNFLADATEPPKGWRCEEGPDEERDTVNRRDETWAEYEDNHDYDHRY